MTSDTKVKVGAGAVAAGVLTNLATGNHVFGPGHAAIAGGAAVLGHTLHKYLKKKKAESEYNHGVESENNGAHLNALKKYVHAKELFKSAGMHEHADKAEERINSVYDKIKAY